MRILKLHEYKNREAMFLLNKIDIINSDLLVLDGLSENHMIMLICFYAGKAMARKKTLIVENAELLSDKQIRLLETLHESYKNNIVLLIG